MNANTTYFSDSRPMDSIPEGGIDFSKKFGNFTKDVYKKTGQIYKKIEDLGKRYLTCEELTKHAKNFVWNKIVPFSNPTAYDKKIVSEKKHQLLLKTIKSKQRNKIEKLKQRITNTHTQNEKTKLEEELKDHEALKSKINTTCQNTTKTIEYCETQQATEKWSRLIGHATDLSNAIVPGSGTVIKLTLIATKVISQEKCAHALDHDQSFAREEQRNVRKRTYIKTGLLALTMLAIPLAKQVAGYFWNRG